ncbi:MAG: hypothetical protein WKF94_03640 [Solirubrobacteraceae bacterium]
MNDEADEPPNFVEQQLARIFSEELSRGGLSSHDLGDPDDPLYGAVARIAIRAVHLGQVELVARLEAEGHHIDLGSTTLNYKGVDLLKPYVEGDDS